MQDNNNNQGKDKLKDMVGTTLHNFEAEPPAGLWNRIEGGLAKRRRRIMLLRTTSIAASLLLLIGLGITWFTTDLLHTSDNKTISDRTTISKEIRYKPEISTTPSATKPSTSGTSESSTNKIKSTTGTNPDNNIEQPIEINQPAADLALTDEPIEMAEQPIDLAKVPMEIKLPTINPVEPPASKSSDPSWSLAMGYGLSSGLDLTQNKEELTNDGSRYSHDDFTSSLANGTSYFEEIENTIHDAPLTLGITIDKRIARRLSVETGIIYTRLGFTVKTDDMSSFYRKYRNELYYLGIPVGLRYSFVERKRFDLYALQWLVLEKGISGKWYVDTYTNNEITESESTGHDIRGIQLSTITGLGAEIKLTGKFYLFGQGGVQVFYLNETQPYNIRSSRVAWPSFQAGLRIGL